MFSRIRKLLWRTNPPPQRGDFPSATEWLESWVAHRISRARGHPAQVLHLGGQPAAYVFGSIGLDTAIDCSGSFWVATYELDEETPPIWREASQREATWIAVCATKRHPELVALIPSRPPNATPCGACQRTGFVYQNVVICEECSALGWIPTDGA